MDSNERPYVFFMFFLIAYKYVEGVYVSKITPGVDVDGVAGGDVPP